MYPVIGRTACPADMPNCTDPGPMFVMFSGPTVNLLESVGGASLEWYQPIHETGNVFSYPWSLEQLQAAEGGIDLLTSSDPDGFATDSSTHTAEATWAGQQTTTSTSGTASTRGRYRPRSPRARASSAAPWAARTSPTTAAWRSAPSTP
jgi:hypothetical protein